ncbi:MAG: DnaJ domain-containing protein [Crocinitomicaceae bacterium]
MDELPFDKKFAIFLAIGLFVTVLIATKNIKASFVATSFVLFLFFANDQRVQHKKKTKYTFLAEENFFSNSLLLLISAVIRCDGKKEDSEFRFIEQALLEHYDAKRVIKMMNYIKSHLDDGPINYRSVCVIIRQQFPLSSKIQLMHLLIGVCAADGLMTKTESALLQDIAIQIRLPKATFDSIHKMFHFRYEGQEQKQKQKTYSSKLRLSEAYAILEITESASVEEIKKAYRKMALKHHPDRVIHLGAEYQKSAKEKFQIIADAYEYIKSKKGFS